MNEQNWRVLTQSSPVCVWDACSIRVCFVCRICNNGEYEQCYPVSREYSTRFNLHAVDLRLFTAAQKSVKTDCLENS